MTSVFITIIIQCILSIFLIYNFKNKEHQLKYLYLYLLVITVDFVHEFLLYQYYSDITILSDIPSSFRYIKGPLLFFFISKKTSKNKIVLHSLPFIFAFTLNICILISIVIDMELSRLYEFYKILFIIYPFYWIAYLIFCIYKINKQGSFSKKINIEYTKYLLYFIFSTVTAMMILYYTNTSFTQKHIETIRQIYSSLFLVQFALIVMIHLKSQQFVSAENNSTKKEKYSSTNTTEEEIQKICNDIQNGFVVQKLHQNENLTLGDFSSKINYSRHQVTEAISIGLQTNFYDLVNKYRINTFIEILKKSPNQNITDVFYESGFKSKATFYKYFKKYQNMSPKAFKDSLTS